MTTKALYRWKREGVIWARMASMCARTLPLTAVAGVPGSDILVLATGFGSESEPTTCLGVGMCEAISTRACLTSCDFRRGDRSR